MRSSNFRSNPAWTRSPSSSGVVSRFESEPAAGSCGGGGFGPPPRSVIVTTHHSDDAALSAATMDAALTAAQCLTQTTHKRASKTTLCAPTLTPLVQASVPAITPSSGVTGCGVTVCGDLGR